MILLFLKKTLYDYWDNFIKLILCNIGYIILMFLNYGAYLLINSFSIDIPVIKEILISIIVCISFFIYSGAVNGFVRDIAYYNDPGIKDFLKHLKNSFTMSILFGILFYIVILVTFFAFIFYNDLNFEFSIAAQIIILCTMFFIINASQYFYPIYYAGETNFLKIIKRTFIFLIDNPLFSISLLLFSTVLILLSLVTFTLIPGFATIPLLFHIGFKLRMYKYKYLEENPSEDNKIPWTKLLTDENKKVGTRTLRDLLFPWK